MEGWRVIEFGPRSFGIERDADKIIIGCIDLIDGFWRVHILQPGGSSKGDFSDYNTALKFVGTALAETAS